MEIVGDYEYIPSQIIGHGAFAIVFKGKNRITGQKVAIKRVAKKNIPNKSDALLRKEIRILTDLSKLQHEHLVQLLDCRESPQFVFLVMEYCNGGDLAELLQVRKTLNEDTIAHFLRHIAQALKAMVERDIVHRDIKPQNLLIYYPESVERQLALQQQRATPGAASSRLPNAGRGTSRMPLVDTMQMIIKIADFGFARVLSNGIMAATLCGSPMYMAPEVIMQMPYDAKADIWSVGTIVYQALTGNPPFPANTPHALREIYEKTPDLKPNIPSTASPALRDLLYRMLTRNSRERINFEDFFNHEFICLVGRTRTAPSFAAAAASSSSPLSSSPSSRQLASAQSQLVRPSAAGGAAAGTTTQAQLQTTAASGVAGAPSKIPSVASAAANLAQPPPFTAPKPPVFAGGIRGLMPKIPDGGQQQVGLVAPLTTPERVNVTPPRSDVTPPPLLATAQVPPSQTQPPHNPAPVRSQQQPNYQQQAPVRPSESGSPPRQQQQQHQHPPLDEGEPMSDLPAPPPGMLLDASASEDGESLTVSVNRDLASVTVSVNRPSSSAASVNSQLPRGALVGEPGLGLARPHQETGSGLIGRGPAPAGTTAARPTNPVATAMCDDSSMSASESGAGGPLFPPIVSTGVLPAYERSSGIIDRDRFVAQATTPIKTSIHAAGEFDEEFELVKKSECMDTQEPSSSALPQASSARLIDNYFNRNRSSAEYGGGLTQLQESGERFRPQSLPFGIADMATGSPGQHQRQASSPRRASGASPGLQLGLYSGEQVLGRSPSKTGMAERLGAGAIGQQMATSPLAVPPSAPFGSSSGGSSPGLTFDKPMLAQQRQAAATRGGGSGAQAASTPATAFEATLGTFSVPQSMQVRVGPGSTLMPHAKWPDLAPTGAATGGDRHSPLYENLPTDMISIPELSEETLMEAPHKETMEKLQLVMLLVECVREVIESRAAGIVLSNDDHAVGTRAASAGDPASAPGPTFVCEAQRLAEQLVLHLRALQMLTLAFHMASAEFRGGALKPTKAAKKLLDQMRTTYTTMFGSARELQQRLTTDQKLVAEFETVADTRCSADELLFNYAIDKCYSAAFEQLIGSFLNSYKHYQIARAVFHYLAEQSELPQDHSLLVKFRESVEKRLGEIESQLRVAGVVSPGSTN